MKTITSILLLTLLGANLVAAEQSILRYNLSGALQLSMEQDIYPGGRTEPLAGRHFEMTFAISESENANQLHAELTNIKGSYNAHGMNQRLSVSHLAGQQTLLGSDGLSIGLQDPGRGLSLGPTTDGELHPSAILVDVLPTLPSGPVTSGMSWETEQAVRSLEGWAWAGGDMHFEHQVASLGKQDGHVIAHVLSQGRTTVIAANGTTGFVGDGTLERRIDWSFDVDTGQLLSLSMEQEGTGTNQLPQGQVEVRQVTRIELGATSP